MFGSLATSRASSYSLYTLDKQRVAFKVPRPASERKNVKVFAFFGKSTESDAALVKRVLLEALVPLDSKLERLSGDVFKLDQAVAKLDSKLERLSADASQMKVDLEVLKASSNKDLKVYLLVALIASTGVMALVPYAVKTLP